MFLFFVFLFYILFLFCVLFLCSFLLVQGSNVCRPFQVVATLASRPLVRIGIHTWGGAKGSSCAVTAMGRCVCLMPGRVLVG